MLRERFRFGQIPTVIVVIVAASFLLNLALGTYSAVFSNFTGQELRISAGQYGTLAGIREIPGLATVVLVALVTRIRDERLYAITIGLSGIGIWLFSTAHTYTDLIIATLVYSCGFHVWSVMQDSMVLRVVPTGDRATRLGQINSVAAAATLAGMGIVGLAGRFFTTLRPFFVAAGIFALGGGLMGLLLKPGATSPRKAAIVFRREYRSYYILTLLQGARRHIVQTFAGFALVTLFGTPVSTMALLLALQSFLAIWTRPLIGKLIDRVGEQRALSLNYGAVAAIFLGYAFIRIPWVYYVLFASDNVLTGFDIAVSTHAGRIITSEDLSPSLATGTTINHIFGVSVPIVGGWLWERFNPMVPFLMGVGIVLVAMVYSWNLDARTAAALREREAV